MKKQLSNLKLGGMALIFFSIALNACAPAASAQSLFASPCHPPTVEGNIYRQSVQPVLGSYYQNAFNNPNDLQFYQSMQHEAIKLLATQTERWSDSIDIALGTKYVRMTVTYLSPELVQTVILNHYLFRSNSAYNNGTFNAQVLAAMETIANRNEHLFFVTLTASTYEQATSYGEQIIVQLPLESLVLTNSSGIQVIPQHNDHNLEQRLDLTFVPAHGYFSFPMAIDVNGNCEFLLDKAYTTHLVLSIPYIEINGIRYETRPWMFDYAPPLGIALDPNPLENRLQVERDLNHFCPCNDLPVSITPMNAEYWENLGRFIWHEMTLDP